MSVVGSFGWNSVLLINFANIRAPMNIGGWGPWLVICAIAAIYIIILCTGVVISPVCKCAFLRNGILDNCQNGQVLYA
jgi:hypothetical protein